MCETLFKISYSQIYFLVFFSVDIINTSWFKKMREFVITDGRDKTLASCRVATAPRTVPTIQGVSFFIASPKTGSCNGQVSANADFLSGKAAVPAHNHETKTLCIFPNLYGVVSHNTITLAKPLQKEKKFDVVRHELLCTFKL